VAHPASRSPPGGRSARCRSDRTTHRPRSRSARRGRPSGLGRVPPARRSTGTSSGQCTRNCQTFEK
jgi:hypothetical protein